MLPQARRVVLGAFLALIVLTGSAAAECAWVLWLVEASSSFEVTGASPTHAECNAEVRRRETGAAKGVADYRRQMKEQFGQEVPAQSGPPTYRLLCIPDTVDPRGPKGSGR